MKNYLPRLGVYGYSYAMERAMFASILTGTPLLLIGKIGEAKTMAARAMAMLILDNPKSFQKIAADKAQFEDMVGFPDPKSLQEGYMKFVKSDITIWDKEFLLIDEISRCNPQMQNKFLEVLLEREVLGIPTGVRWVWATMNPLEYAGSQPLDGALAGRMGYVLQVPETANHGEELIEQIVSTRSHEQTPALAYWTDASRDYRIRFNQDLKTEVKHMIAEAGRIFTGLDDHWTPVASKYLAAFIRTLKTSGLTLDGRRLNMMRNNIIANIAIQTVQTGRSLNMDEIKVLCKEVLLLSIPWQATGLKESFDASKITAAHQMAADYLDKGDSLIYRIVTEQDSLAKVRLAIEHIERIDPITFTNMVTSLYDKPMGLQGEDLWAEEAKRYAIQLALAQLLLRIPNVPSEAVAQIAKQYPVNLFTRGRDLGSIAIENYTQAKQLADLYERVQNSDSHLEWAAGYFAFLPGASKTMSFMDVLRRFEIAHDALKSVVTTLAPYVPQKVNHGSNSNSAAAAVADLLGDDEAEDQEADALGSGLVAAAGQSSRSASVL